MPQRRKSGGLRIGNESRQFPERDRVWRGKALFDLSRCQLCRQIVGGAMNRTAVGPTDPGVKQMPVPTLQVTGCGIDPPCIAILVLIVEYDDVFEVHALIRNPQCMHDRLM